MIIPALYHWSPATKRPNILRRGLLPRTPHSGCPSCCDGDGYLTVCLSSTPSWAWGLSGRIVGKTGETWDLWQLYLDDGDTVFFLPEFGKMLKEVRVANRIPKSRIWLVGSRVVGQGKGRNK